jgi:hypothetical protein
MKKECATFNWQNRLTSDSCARKATEQANKEFEEYNLFNFYNGGRCSDKLRDFACEYPNLWFRDGFGVADACVIDESTKTQHGKLTHGREKRQANIRTFHAVPDLSHGCLLPITESRLVQGTCSSHHIKKCDILSERDFNRFVPFVDCVKSHLDDFIPANVHAIGVNTRELTRKKMSC